jgi:hypothetical protein
MAALNSPLYAVPSDTQVARFPAYDILGGVRQ